MFSSLSDLNIIIIHIPQICSNNFATGFDQPPKGTLKLNEKSSNGCGYKDNG
jgi:hypothetical protein